MPCKQYFLNYFGQNKGYHGFLQLFSVKFISSTKQWILGKKCENSWFSLFFVWTNKNPKCWCKMIARTMVEISAKFLKFSVKNWRSYGHFSCCHGNCHLNFISWCSFWAHWGKNFVKHIFWFSCRQFLFTMSVFSEIRRKDLIWTMTSLCWWRHGILWRHSMGMSLIYVMSFCKLFYSQLEMLICISIKLSRIKMLSNRNQCSVTS